MSKRHKKKSRADLPNPKTTKTMKAQTTVTSNSKHVEMGQDRVTRSSPRPRGYTGTPSSLYDFIGESPLTDRDNKASKQKQARKATGKHVRKTEVTKTRSKCVEVISRAKARSKVNANNVESNVTPKVRASKPVLKTEISNSNKDAKEIRRKHRALKPILPPNLDDISPIVRSDKSSISKESRKRAADPQVKVEKKTSSSSKAIKATGNKNISYLESEDGVTMDDSAIFLSPRLSSLRFSSGKTSTPADISAGGTKKASKRLMKNNVKDTSTPNETKSKRYFTGIKDNISKLSPVQREDTPTSDYGSMEIIPSPDPTPHVTGKRKKRSNSPAFTLDHSDSEENLTLNKTMDRSYKKIPNKRKYEGTRSGSSSKLDEWAEKVNSELEDIENFELSVEG